jgi:hypothetical protein
MMQLYLWDLSTKHKPQNHRHTHLSLLEQGEKESS